MTTSDPGDLSDEDLVREVQAEIADPVTRQQICDRITRSAEGGGDAA